MKTIMILLAVFFTIVTMSFAEDVIVVERTDGGISVIRPAGNTTLQEAYDDAIGEICQEGQPYYTIDDSQLPDREYRNYWEADNGSITINMDAYNADRPFDAEACKATLFDEFGDDIVGLLPYYSAISDLLDYKDIPRLKAFMQKLIASGLVDVATAQKFKQIVKAHYLNVD